MLKKTFKEIFLLMIVSTVFAAVASAGDPSGNSRMSPTGTPRPTSSPYGSPTMRPTSSPYGSPTMRPTSSPSVRSISR